MSRKRKSQPYKTPRKSRRTRSGKGRNSTSAFDPQLDKDEFQLSDTELREFQDFQIDHEEKFDSNAWFALSDRWPEELDTSLTKDEYNQIGKEKKRKPPRPDGIAQHLLTQKKR